MSTLERNLDGRIAQRKKILRKDKTSFSVAKKFNEDEEADKKISDSWSDSIFDETVAEIEEKKPELMRCETERER